MKKFRHSITFFLSLMNLLVMIVIISAVAVAGVKKSNEDVDAYFDAKGYLLVSHACDVIDIHLNSDDNVTLDNVEDTAAVSYLEYMCEENPDIDVIYLVLPTDEPDTGKQTLMVSQTEVRKDDYLYSLAQSEMDLLAGRRYSAHGSYERGDEEYLTYMYAIFDDAGDDTLALGIIGVDFRVKDIKSSQAKKITSVIISLGICLIAIFAAISIVIRVLVLKPVLNISSALRNLVSEDSISKDLIEVKGNNEIGDMARDYNTMVERLDKYINDLERLYREREDTKAQFRIASGIQLGMAPKDKYSDKDVAIGALLVPAEYVGGDMFDYYDVGDDKICFVIADVSGEGITAAMFTAFAIVAIRYNMLYCASPSAALTRANEDIIKRNPQSMFITAFAAVYDRKEHTLTYSNAGHNNPYILSDGVMPLEGAHSAFLGAFDDEEYTDETVDIKEGDVLFMYTDGVVEAMDGDKNQYTSLRLADFLTNNRCLKEKVVQKVLEDIFEFKNGAPQNDDITMMAVSFESSYDSSSVRHEISGETIKE